MKFPPLNLGDLLDPLPSRCLSGQGCRDRGWEVAGLSGVLLKSEVTQRVVPARLRSRLTGPFSL